MSDSSGSLAPAEQVNYKEVIIPQHAAIEPCRAHSAPLVHTVGGIELHADLVEEVYYMDIPPEHDPLDMAEIYAKADELGLEELGDDEMPHEYLDDSTIRVWFAEVVD